MNTLHHFRTSNSTRWALILVLWVVLLCLMKNMHVLSTACPMSAVQSNITAPNLTSLSDNHIESKAELDASQCHLSEQLLQFHFHQIDSAVISYLLPSLIIAAFLWFSFVSHRRYHNPPIPKRRLHLELCTFQE